MLEKTITLLRQQGNGWLQKTTEKAKRRGWFRKSNLPYFAVAGFWLVYVIILLITPPSEATTSLLSQTALNIVKITIAIPYLVIWMAALYSYLNINRYSNSIKNSKEARGFRYLALGILILLGALVFSTFISSISSYFRNNGHSFSLLTIITNYLYIFPYAAAFGSFWLASKLLTNKLKGEISNPRLGIYAAIFVLFLYVWLDLIFTNPARSIPNPATGSATYYLKDSLIVLTIVIPAFVGWVLSIGALINMQKFARFVEGKIYRKGISHLVIGIGAIILGSAFFQGLLSLGTERLLSIGLGTILLLIYLFFVIQVVGFVFVARGARALKKIETI